MAESHSHTTQKEFNQFLKSSFRHKDGSRCRYVNYVYCIGNSESYALEGEPMTRRRTSQYWRILYSCLYPVEQNIDFKKFENGDSKDRVQRKEELISDLRKSGIWLLDASIIGINILDSNARKSIIKKCWEARFEQLFLDLKADGLACVITVGATVHEALGSYLEKMGLMNVEIDQPQRRLKGGYLDNYNLIHKTCQRYKIG